MGALLDIALQSEAGQMDDGVADHKKHKKLKTHCNAENIPANDPGPIPHPMGGSLPHEDVEIIKAVCSAWGATPDETRDAIAEASSNPALMDGWRGETKKLADSELTELTKGVLSVLSVHPRAYFSEAPMPDDRITCQQCRRLKPGNLCGSPEWKPRYHPPPLPHRCAEFLPRVGDPDRRPGRERWPGLGGMKP